MLASPKGADLPVMNTSGRTDRMLSRWRREAAQTMAEYVVVLAVITPVVLLAFATLSSAVLPAINAVVGYL